MILVNGNPLEDITLLSHHENLDLIMIVRSFPSFRMIQR